MARIEVGITHLQSAISEHLKFWIATPGEHWEAALAHPKGAHQGPPREGALAQGRAAGLPAALPARTPCCNAGAEALLKYYIMKLDMLGHSEYTARPHTIISMHMMLAMRPSHTVRLPDHNKDVRAFCAGH